MNDFENYQAPRAVGVLATALAAALLCPFSAHAAFARELAKLTPPASTGFELSFGSRVALQDGIALIGEWYKSHEGQRSHQGSAHLFEAETGVHRAELFPDFDRDVGNVQSVFGVSVALSDGVAWVGETGSFQIGIGTGAFFSFDTRTGERTGVLVPNQEEPACAFCRKPSDDFGGSIAIDGDVAVVGSVVNPATGRYTGVAYTIDMSSNERLATLLPMEETGFSQLGTAVAIDGEMALVARESSPDHGTTVSLFDVHTGERLSTLAPSESLPPRGNFGRAVAIDGDYALIGAPDEMTGNLGSGAVYVFDTRTGDQVTKLLPTSGALGFGFSVALEDGIALIGAPNSSRDAGSAFLFNAATGAELATLLPSDDARAFGQAVALSDGLALVGAPGSSAAYIFDIRVPEPTSVGLMATVLASCISLPCRSGRHGLVAKSTSAPRFGARCTRRCSGGRSLLIDRLVCNACFTGVGQASRVGWVLAPITPCSAR